MVTVPIKLPADEIAVGHCVILNDCEQPCGRLVAVITSIRDGIAFCNYLNKDPMLSSYNKKLGMAISLTDSLHNLTPVGKFGVDVFYECNPPQYWCERVRDSVATYRDGRLRKWQENVPFNYPPRKEVLAICLASPLMETPDKEAV